MIDLVAELACWRQHEHRRARRPAAVDVLALLCLSQPDESRQQETDCFSASNLCNANQVFTRHQYGPAMRMDLCRGGEVASISLLQEVDEAAWEAPLATLRLAFAPLVPYLYVFMELLVAMMVPNLRGLLECHSDDE